MNISIINYHAGNAPSVYHSFKKLGLSSRLVDEPSELEKSDLIVLPGVGAAATTINSLEALGFMPKLEQKVLEEKTAFFGICIGYQLLFDYSEESNVDCFGWIKGRVKKFDSSKVLVPQIGWNQCSLSGKHSNSEQFLIRKPKLGNKDNTDYFYFVNSYYATPDDPTATLYTTNYGDTAFTSMLVKNNIAGSQFHIEKSGQVGLKLLENVVEWSKNLK